jgi:hypothetical protein
MLGQLLGLQSIQSVIFFSFDLSCDTAAYFEENISEGTSYLQSAKRHKDL